jgi:galactofuranose transport system substrate-binding protein
MVLCYPQLGAESDWRTANTASFKENAEKLGIKQLVFSDAQQKQENQISAMRACIQQGVDVIALPPVVEDGWEAVLTEAKNAGIPVIIVDRSVSADLPCMPLTLVPIWFWKVSELPPNSTG